MFDAKGLLNSLLGADHAGAVSGALQSAQTAVSGTLDRTQARLGPQAGDVLGQARQLAAQNPGVAMAAVGGLAALLMGTGGGREATAGAVRLGGLAALGGLAYKAFSNYQGGKPLMEGVPGLQSLTAPAPAQTGFHPDDHSHDAALAILHGMIATAAADGVVDAGERAKILAEMQRSGVDADATQFLNAAIASPQTPAEIAAAVGGNQQLAVQVYCAASLMVEPGNAPEQAYLARLGTSLGLAPGLLVHLQAAIGGASAA